ncbi:hypothetical protein GCM10009022_08340 [Vreelandella titanicae]
MFNALIYRQQAKVTGARQTAVIKERLHIAQHRWAAVAIRHNTVNKVWARQVQALTGYALARVIKQTLGVTAKQSGYISHDELLYICM